MKRLITYAREIEAIKEIILTDIVLLGQASCGPLGNGHGGGGNGDRYPRADIFLDRWADSPVDDFWRDAGGNPWAVIKGTDEALPPIFLVAHMDTDYGGKSELFFNVTGDAVVGPGLLDNSLGAGVLMAMPRVLKTLGLSFGSDIVLVGLVESLRQSNLKSIRELLKSWNKPIRGAICIEGGERGRLNYFSNSMIRVEITCDIPKVIGWAPRGGVNAIVVVNEVINRILEIRLPQRPTSNIIIGRINSGSRYGKIPLWAGMGLEVHSESDDMVEEVYNTLDEICGNVAHHSGARVQLRRVSGARASRLPYHHPLVQHSVKAMRALGIAPKFEPSQSELTEFLSRNIPAVTLGVAHGENYHSEKEQADIKSMFKGIAQIVGIMEAVDQGVCDDQ